MFWTELEKITGIEIREKDQPDEKSLEAFDRETGIKLRLNRGRFGEFNVWVEYCEELLKIRE